MPKRIFDALFTAMVLVLAVPTSLVLISWNAIPGDGLYPLKSGLEDAALGVLSGTPLVPQVSMKFTDRRLTEAGKLLDKKGSTVGYDLLLAEARQTQNYIVEKNSTETGIQFTKNIDEYNKEIEKKKVEVRAEIQANPALQQSSFGSNPTPVPAATPVPTGGGGQQVTINVQETVTITEEDPKQVLKKLDDTEEELKRIKKDLEKGGNNGQGNDNGKGKGNQ